MCHLALCAQKLGARGKGFTWLVLQIEKKLTANCRAKQKNCHNHRKERETEKGILTIQPTIKEVTDRQETASKVANTCAISV